MSQAGVSEISVHPSWSGTAGIYSSADVALLTLDTEVDTCCCGYFCVLQIVKCHVSYR